MIKVNKNFKKLLDSRKKTLIIRTLSADRNKFFKTVESDKQNIL